MDSSANSNTFWLTFRVVGDLPSREAIEELLGAPLRSFKRKDSKATGALATHDVATALLAKWEGDNESRDVFLTVAATLRNWAPALNTLMEQYHCSVSLSLSAFRETDTGGVEFPADFLQAIVDNHIAFGISIQARFLWNDEDDS